jgi:hypothetical protein
MKIGRFLLYIGSVILLSCGDDKSTTEVLDLEKSEQKQIITAKAIEQLDYTDYVLSSDSENAVSTWEKYQELEIQINYLKKADLSFFNGDKDILKKFIQEFTDSIPEQLKTNPIVSRSVILETTLLKLNENLGLENISETDKLLNIKEVLVAFSSLNYHINKKLESDFYDKIQPE